MPPSSDGVFESIDVGSGTTLFYRDAPAGVEGFVVDNQILVETLKERVLSERGLSEVVDVAPLGSRAGPELDVAPLTHQFAEPFTAVQASLRLTALEVPWSEQLLLPLTFVLGALIVLGLWALYRMVSTQLEFAERQSNFVAAVSHELKTPLTAIRMHGEMLRDGLVEGRQKEEESFSTITAQAERLSRLIGNVLLLSKIEHAPPPQPAKGDLVELLDGAQAALLPHIEKSGFSLQVDVPSVVPPVLREPDGVEQILFNLVDNALKYAKTSEDKRLTLSLEVTSETVNLIVRDRGPGIPETERKRVFEPFFRLEDEMTRKNKGTGLGLALVADLAARMNARVRAENANPGLAVIVEFSRGD